LDFGRSFTFVFEDEKWLIKILIGGLVALIPIVNFAIFGYMVETIRRAKEGAVPVLPEWSDFLNYFVRGLVFGLGYFIYMLVPILLIVIVSAMSPVNILGLEPSNVTGLGVLFAFLVIFYLLVLLIFYPAITLNYASRLTFSSFFDFGTIIKLVSSDPGQYVLCLVNILLAAIVSAIAAGIPLLGWLLAIFVGFYVNLVMAGAIAQYWLIVENQRNVAV